MSDLLTAAASKNASPTPRQGKEFDVHFEQASGTGDGEPETRADSASEVLQISTDPDDDSQAPPTGSSEFSENATDKDDPESPMPDAALVTENLAAKGILPTGSQSTAPQLAQNPVQTRSVLMSAVNPKGANGIQSTAAQAQWSETIEAKTKAGNPDALTTQANQWFAASRASETSVLAGRVPILPNQNSGQVVPGSNPAQISRQAAELLTDRSAGSGTHDLQRANSAFSTVNGNIPETPGLGNLTGRPVQNGRVSGTIEHQNTAPGNPALQTPNATVSVGNTTSVSGGASETTGLTGATAVTNARPENDNLSPTRSRRSIRNGDPITSDTAAAPPTKVTVQTVDAFKTAQNQLLSAANIRPLAEQRVLTAEAAPSEHFVTPLSESGLQTGNLRTSETMLARPEAARMVASQMAEAVMRTQNNKIEIALRPEELGRVRMVLSTTELGVTVSIVAERSETLDLMRRHIDQLAQEFRELGYQNIGFEFSGGESSQGSGGNPSDSQSKYSSIPENQSDAIGSVQIQTARASQSSGLDLRL